MKEYSLTGQYAIIALEGMDSQHPSLAKCAAVRGIAAAKLLERLLFTEEAKKPEELKAELETGLKDVKSMKKEELHGLEAEMAKSLLEAGALDEVPDLLACDIDYDTAGVDILAYRGSQKLHRSIIEGTRAEILEYGPVTLECLCLLWLFRESGCLHDIFSLAEQQVLSERMVLETSANPVYSAIWNAEFHSSLKSIAAGFLNAKTSLFKNPYLEGVNVLFPFLDRRQAIFIDFVVLGTDVVDRRMAIVSYLLEKGHYVDVVKSGTESLLKIDNSYYRIFPMTRIYCRIPVQGANLIPVYQ